MEKFKKILPYILIVVFVVLLRTFIVTPVMVSGGSMNPTLKDNDVLILKKYDHSYERFDIVVVKHDNEELIKRIIGLPNEKVEYKSGKLYVDGEEIKDKFSIVTNDFNFPLYFSGPVPEGYYLVLGDNRVNSVDSRIIGYVSENEIKGVVGIRLFPFNKIGKIGF